jgi:hypothetical protein
VFAKGWTSRTAGDVYVVLMAPRFIRSCHWLKASAPSETLLAVVREAPPPTPKAACAFGGAAVAVFDPAPKSTSWVQSFAGVSERPTGSPSSRRFTTEGGFGCRAVITAGANSSIPTGTGSRV